MPALTGPWRPTTKIWQTDRRRAAYALTTSSRSALHAPASPTILALQGKTWQLVRFAEGWQTPADDARNTSEFGRRAVNARIDCNRGRATWKAAPASGPIELGPLALSRARCPAGSMHDPIVRLWGYIRSYLITAGHLFLSLMLEFVRYEFEPPTAAQKQSDISPKPRRGAVTMSAASEREASHAPACAEGAGGSP